MVGYNVLEMYLRMKGFFLAFKRFVEKITLGGPHFSEVTKSVPRVHFLKLF